MVGFEPVLEVLPRPGAGRTQKGAHHKEDHQGGAASHEEVHVDSREADPGGAHCGDFRIPGKTTGCKHAAKETRDRQGNVELFQNQIEQKEQDSPGIDPFAKQIANHVLHGD